MIVVLSVYFILILGIPYIIIKFNPDVNINSWPFFVSFILGLPIWVLLYWTSRPLNALLKIVKKSKTASDNLKDCCGGKCRCSKS